METVEPYNAFELLEAAEENTLSGLWYLYGETGLPGRLSGRNEQPFRVVSQNLESSESSDIGEYCEDISSLKNQLKGGGKCKNTSSRNWKTFA